MQKNTFNIGCIFLRCVLCALFALTDISAHAADTCSILDNSQCTSSTTEYSNNIFCQMGVTSCVNFSSAILRTEDCNFCQEGYRLQQVDCDNGSFSTCISCASVDNSKYCPGAETAIDCPENGKCSNGIFTGCEQGYKWDVGNWNNSSCTLCESYEYCPGEKSGAFTCPDEDSITLGDDEGEIEPHSTINQEGCYKPDGSPYYPGYLGYSFNNTEYSIQYCNACKPGYYDDGTNADIIIPSAMEFSEDKLVCHVKKAQALNCVQCGDGEYCPGYQGDNVYPKNKQSTCPEGYYCEQGERFPCDTDQFCPAGSSEAQVCPTGSVCNGSTISGCEPGYYWADKKNQGSTTIKCEPCTVGYYCPGGSGSDAKQIQCAEGQATDGSGAVPCCLRDVLAAPIYIGRNVSNTKCPADETDFECNEGFPIFGTEVRTGNNSYYICSACDSGYVCDENGVNTGCANGYYDNDTSDEVVNCVPCNDDNNVVTIQGNSYYKNGAYCTNSERHLCSSELSKGYPDMKFYAYGKYAESSSACFVLFETGTNYADNNGVFTVLEEKIIGIEQCE